MKYEELIARAESRLFIIGEAGVNHNGSLAGAKALVDAAVVAGCDAVKFQTWITEKVYSRELSAKPEYQRRATGDVESVYDIVKKLELSFEALQELKRYCDERGILFFATPDEQDSADFLMRLGVPLMKSASQDVTNLPFLRYLARLGVPLIFSTGASTEEELDQAVSTLHAEGAQLTILHCVSSYPAPLEQLNLRLIPALSERYGVPVGFSDHTLGPEAACAAVALGARIFEKHFTISKDQEGPDHQASATPDELRHYVQVLRALREGLGDGVKRIMPAEEDTRSAFRRFLVTARPIAKGAVLAADDFVFKKTTHGVEPAALDEIVGLTALVDLAEDVPLRWEHVAKRMQPR
jgi:N,N'-diacetyllegionaminate synthase